MIAIINVAVMFGFVYFAALGFKTTIHNRQARNEARRRIHRRRRPIIDGGSLAPRHDAAPKIKRLPRK